MPDESWLNGGGSQGSTSSGSAVLEEPLEPTFAQEPWSRSTANLRRHLVRDVIRIVTLLVADIATFGALRATLGGIRAIAGSEGTALGWFLDLFPAGFAGGWQLGAALITGLVVTGCYRAGDHRRDVGRLFYAAVLAALFVFFDSLWAGDPGLIILRMAATAGVLGSVLAVERTVIDRLVDRVRIPTVEHYAVLIGNFETDEAEFNELEMLMTSKGLTARFALVEKIDVGEGPCSQCIDRLNDVIEEGIADTVIAVGPLDADVFDRVVDTSLAHGCRLLSTPRRPGMAGITPRSIWVNGVPLTELTAPTLKAWQLGLKRFVDVVGSLLGLLVLAPLFLVLAVAIKIDSRGSIFFVQRRLGRGGRPFPCIKFRTMREDAEDVLRSRVDLYQLYLENNFKIPPDDDPRLTTVGRWLRKASLDELPQLFNVLVGHMSLVGPRPIVPAELKHYEGIDALFVSLRPGMTGKWAVEGRSGVGYPDRAGMELQYVREWSLLKDFRILLATVPCVMEGTGAH